MATLNKREAAEYLGLSVRAVERATKQLTPAYVHGRHGIEARYDTEQLDKFKAERAAPIERVTPPSALARRGVADLVAGNADPAGPDLLARVATALESLAPAGPPYLTVPAASEAFGVRRGILTRAVKAGLLPARPLGPSRAPVVRRADVRAYLERVWAEGEPVEARRRRGPQAADGKGGRP